MIRSKFFVRVTSYAGAAVLAASFGIGCGDDDGPSDPPVDAPPADVDAEPTIDAGDDTPDAEPCQGHGCDDIDSPFQLPEGGEFRLERFQTGAMDTQDSLAGQAFFFKGQEPTFRPLDGELVEIRQALADQGYSCSDFTDGTRFDNGSTAEAQSIVDTRTYYDVGETVTLTNEADDTEEINLPKQPPGATDFSASLTHPVLYRDDGEGDVTRDAVYLPSITGSADYPALDLKFGRSVVGEPLHDETTGEGTPKLYMPSKFLITSPTEDDFFANGVTFTTSLDDDVTFEYDLVDQTGDLTDWPTIVPFIGFVTPDDEVTAYCFKTPTDDNPNPDDGEFIVPSEILSVVSTDPGSYILFGRFTHVAWEYQQDFTRMDFLGVECKIAEYTVDDTQ